MENWRNKHALFGKTSTTLAQRQKLRSFRVRGPRINPEPPTPRVRPTPTLWRNGYTSMHLWPTQQARLFDSSEARTLAVSCGSHKPDLSISRGLQHSRRSENGERTRIVWQKQKATTLAKTCVSCPRFATPPVSSASPPK